MSQTSIYQNIDWRARESTSFIRNKIFELKTTNNNLIFNSQNAVLSLIEQNAGKFKTKPVFFVRIKTRSY
jgi:hypothetical protein